MRKSCVLAISVVTALALAGYASAAEGKALYLAKCQACHGPNGEGKPAIAKMFNVKLLPLGSKDVQSKTDAALRKTVTAGQGKMKAVAGLEDKQVAEIIAFVRTLAQ